MARTYRQDIPAAWAEEDSLSAHLTMHAQRAAEAVYEETRNDLCVLFNESRLYTEMTTFPIRMRRDRRGLYRSFRVTPLAWTPYGSGDLYFYVQDTSGVVYTDAPQVSWLGTSVAGHTWLAPKTVAIPRDFLPSVYLTSDGDERQRTMAGWGLFNWDNVVGGPRLGGYRIEELVEDSWL